MEALEGERSFGGADPEPIESIKAFAPMVFASRGNAVSDGDYVAITRSLFSEADKVNAWGGELNDPPKFGYTMVAVKPKNAKALTAEQLIRQDCWLSFGEKFNPEALRAAYPNRILAETDESLLSIQKIYQQLADTSGIDAQLFSNTLRENVRTVFTI